MKDELKRKLRSNQGMTLLLSLLLFLVCVVAGSVALTAGTASSGTISERAKLDQRYFSVTSAAELIREKFDGKSVRVTVTGTDVNTTIRHNEAWIERNHATPEEKFVIDQSLYLLNPPDDKRPPLVYELEVNTDAPEIDSDKLKITVTVNFTSSGLIFQLENDNGDTEKFRLNMEYIVGLTEIPSGDVITYAMEWHIGKVSYAN